MKNITLMFLCLLLANNVTAETREHDINAEMDDPCVQQANDQSELPYEEAYNLCVQNQERDGDDIETEDAQADYEDARESEDLSNSPAYEAADKACDQQASNQTEVQYWKFYNDCMLKRGFGVKEDEGEEETF